MSKIINTLWFTQMGQPSPIGIVICEDEISHKTKAYIGTGQGYDKGVDAGHILETGAKFTADMAIGIADWLVRDQHKIVLEPRKKNEFL